MLDDSDGNAFIAECDAHGLRYDSRAHAGCVLCRRDAQPTPATSRGSVAWPKWIGLGLLGALVVGLVLAGLEPLLWPNPEERALRAYLERSQREVLRIDGSVEPMLREIDAVNRDLERGLDPVSSEDVAMARGWVSQAATYRADLARIEAPPSGQRHHALLTQMFASLERVLELFAQILDVARRAGRDVNGRRYNVHNRRAQQLEVRADEAYERFVSSCEALGDEHAGLIRARWWFWLEPLRLECRE